MYFPHLTSRRMFINFDILCYPKKLISVNSPCEYEENIFLDPPPRYYSSNQRREAMYLNLLNLQLRICSTTLGSLVSYYS